VERSVSIPSVYNKKGKLLLTLILFAFVTYWLGNILKSLQMFSHNIAVVVLLCDKRGAAVIIFISQIFFILIIEQIFAL
jgi:hypothetical protein